MPPPCRYHEKKAGSRNCQRDLAPALDVDPNAITTMRVLAEWPPGSEYRIALNRIILKDACTCHKQDTWDRREPLAA